MRNPIEIARALVAPYEKRPGVVGAYLSGSSARPYADEHSDLDLYVVCDDETWAKSTPQERFSTTAASVDSDGRAVDIACLSLSALEELTTSRCDGVPAMCRFAVVLFATDNRLSSVLDRVGRLPDGGLEPRLRIAYRELVWSKEKAAKARLRGMITNARLLEAVAVESVRRILFVAQGFRPTRSHWAAQELRLTGVPTSLANAWEAAVASNQPALESLHEAIDAWLTSLGHNFHHDQLALMRWVGWTAEGAAARERFSQAL